METSDAIKPINKDTVHRICSGQVVLSLSIAVKELVENSIDAGATNISVRLKNYGMDSIEISDNGSGVRKENFSALTLKHFTSKIKEFSDLESICTLGFRGEALSSLCALSDLIIITRHSSMEHGTKICYDNSGEIISQEPIARSIGTTVILNNLFTPLPVRRKEFIKNHKKEFNKMCNLLYAYCLVSKGVRFACTNQTDKGNQSTVVSTEGSNQIKDNIISVFGPKQISSLIEVELAQPGEDICQEYGLKLAIGDESPFKFDFFISSVVHGSGRSASDRQFFFINSRPCEPSKINKLINQIYKQFNTNQFPFIFLNIVIRGNMVDVNVTPDKRQIFLQQENLLLATIKATLIEAFKNFPSTFKMQNTDIKDKNEPRGLKRSCETASFLDSFRKKSKEKDEDEEKEVFKTPKIKDKFSIRDFMISSENKCKETKHATDNNAEIKCETNNIEPMNVVIESKLEEAEASKSILQLKKIPAQTIPLMPIIKPKEEENRTVLVEEIKPKEEDDKIVLVEEIKSCKLNLAEAARKQVQLNKKQPKDDRDIVKTGIYKKNRQYLTIDTSINAIKESLTKVGVEDERLEYIKFRTQISPSNNKEAEKELQKEISKDMFSQMEIVGQFNYAFIIARLKQDLFIIDQHASDEKYNYEDLQKNTVLESQKLVNPKDLQLTSAQESVVIENEALFNKNGFHFTIDHTAEATKKVKLSKIPLSKNYIFGKDDIDEMIHMIQEGNEINCRPSRVSGMFASRACRKSIMVGRPLKKSDMKKLVVHMGEIEQPWNCPHGRPTMRHLVNLDLLKN